jgi:hypothetical protein
MTLIENPNIVCIDIDDTLVYWNTPLDPNQKLKYFDIYTDYGKEVLAVNEKILEDIDRHRLRGHFIVIWSQGGNEWCKAVCTSLGITDKINMIMSKPKWYIDDLPADSWMKRIIP